MRSVVSALPRPVGFVLGGGASLGAVQVGMLQALRDAGVVPDQITGSSVGALNGAILAADARSGLDHLTRMWTDIERGDVFPGNVLTLAWRLGRSRTHAVEAAGLRHLLSGGLAVDGFVVDAFADLDTPLAVVAVDLGTGREYVLDSGALLPAVLASAAIPGVYPAVEIDGRPLVDGGVLANLPVRQALDRGARSLVLLDTTVPAPAVSGEPGVRDVLGRVSHLQLRAQLEAALPAAAREVPVVSLPAPPARRVSPFDFSASAALIADAADAAARFLGELAPDGPGVYGDPFTRYVDGEPNAVGSGLTSTVPG